MNNIGLKALLAVILTAGLVGPAYSCTECHKAAPNGYEIITDGKVYRFRFPSGNISIYDKKTKHQAIAWAWKIKKDYDAENRCCWRPAN